VSTIVSPTFRSLSAAEQQRKLQLFRELDRQLKAGYNTAQSTTLREMAGYARLEAEIAQTQITTVVETEALDLSASPLITSQAMNAIAQLPIQGLSLGEWFDAQANTMSRETRRAIQNGLVTGRSLPEIVRDIVPPRTSVAPAVFRRARNEVTAVTRTTVNAVQNFAAVESYRAAGNDISDSYRFVAVRDSRTSAICRALDGKIFRNDDDSAPRPPMHINCRSSVVPIVNDAFLSKTAQKNQPLTFGSYASWLETQSDSQQNSILGSQRADLWRNGRMTLADAIDADNRVLSLSELRARLGLNAPAHAGGVV
jgi:SPP1 gp7 family putative phage head morphogenesis protein